MPILHALAWLVAGLAIIAIGVWLLLASPSFGAVLFVSAAIVGVLTIALGFVLLVVAVMRCWLLLASIVPELSE